MPNFVQCGGIRSFCEYLPDTPPIMLLKNLQFVSALLLLTLLQACASGQKGKDTSGKTIVPGETCRSVSCLADTSQKYSLFVPASYKEGKKCPVLICFDSHAEGLLPVNLFRKEAGKAGFIVAGSNNSKNGMATEATTALFRNLLADLQQRFTLDNAAVYLAGFSGGSRVAGAAAITEGNIAGVVGCGAGLPGLNQQPKTPFSYLAVVGAQDFNYTEMRQLNEELEKAGFVHHLLIFDGIHQWPPETLVPDIFSWLQFDRMRRGCLPADRNIINAFIDLNYRKAQELGNAGNKIAEQETYQMMRDYLQGLTDIAPLDAEIAGLGKDATVVQQKAAQNALLEKEKGLQGAYAPAVQQKDPDWWKREAAKLHALADKQPSNDETRMYRRVLGYLSLNAYMVSNSALKQEDLTSASRFIEIYRLVDPGNAEHRYMAAVVSARQGKTDEAFSNLADAVKLGFKDYARLRNDPQLDTLHRDSRFKIYMK